MDEPKKRTNYEDIKEFSVDEMAKFLANLQGGGSVRVKAIKEWLMEEAE
jgi:hypothetical protein